MQEGDEQAFTVLYGHYGPRLYVNILRMVKDQVQAEEIVQELFTRIWQQRRHKAIAENFQGYIYRIGQNLVYDFYRSLKRDAQLLEKFRVFAQQHYEHIEEALQDKQHHIFLQQAMKQLSPQQRRVYELVKINGHTYKQAAEILGISPLTVKEYLVATNKLIRNYILANTDAAAILIVSWSLYFGLH
ncbi:sigma-70 family RNA polymerase sigma factor [Terrimonas sp. NA20]|uniref:Sigma-70 family RNA polymerase sigma factor n=1 Tax=Terrimonas ginsenosidimutans TaxID=2908004 RepID=A0ABS9KLX7_9BACT|nr:sigma-70 family RNA polymerase sigma factor [Terrimonas ginsenosidimutans]MCG2613330.1 sigma-70 family RNA polymerase sigma factor [Terrimonas ginsenosidimutans]